MLQALGLGMIRYSRWSEQSRTAEQELDEMFQVFTYVLLQFSGDAQQAIDFLRQLDDEQQLMSTMSMDDFVRILQDRGFVEQDANGTFQTGARADRAMRAQALEEIFRSLKKSSAGTHDVPVKGAGNERLPETRDFSYGDVASNIDATETLTNLVKRTGDVDAFGLNESDIRVYETETQTSCATVLMIDVSHSMILYGEDRITPAKQVAIALAELIRTKYPKDVLEVILFGDDARRVTVKDLPYITVGPFHTNTRAGLRLARQLLKRQKNANKQIFMVTDGKPSALTMDTGRIYKNSWGLDPMIVNKTLDEATACRKDGISIATFMVAEDPYLVNFVEELTKANRGRAFYTALDGLGSHVFVDYINNRRKFI